LGLLKFSDAHFAASPGRGQGASRPGLPLPPAAAAPQDRDALPWRALLLYYYDDIKKTHRRVKPAIAGNLRAVRRR
jgi:hypothetical protein